MLLGLSVLGLSASGIASAQAHSWYVQGGVGYADFAIEKDFRLSLALSDASYSSDEKDTAYSLGFGRQLGESFALELNYTDYGRVSLRANATLPAIDLSAQVETKALALSALAFAPLSERVSAYALLGVTSWDIAIDSQLQGDAPRAGSVRADDQGTALQLGAGLRFAVNERIKLAFALSQFKAGDDDQTTGLGAEDDMRSAQVYLQYFF